MKIYINTSNQPPTLSASAATQTDAEGVLRVYSASLGSSVSTLAFKRGTTVPIEVIFPSDAAEDVVKLRYGLKLKGRYDDALVLLYESTEPQAQDDGTVHFLVKPTFEAGVIDSALAVDSDSTNDIESAAFISEFEWENADGEITASATAATEPKNRDLTLCQIDKKKFWWKIKPYTSADCFGGHFGYTTFSEDRAFCENFRRS